MTTSPEQFEKWLEEPEGEHLEFKTAANQFSHDKELPDYCAALANEGGGKLILGVTDERVVCGTKAFMGTVSRLSHDLFQKLHIRVSVEELQHTCGRVLVFHVPSHAIGTVVKSTGQYTYPMRAGESIVEMDTGSLKRILDESETDFSARIVPGLTLNDLDYTAIENFKNRWAQKQQRNEYLTYTNEKVLRSIHILHDEELSYAALILFGKKEKIDRLLPDAEIILEWRQDANKITHDFRKIWREPFFKIYDDIWETINARNIRFPYQDGFFQYEVYAFSEKPVREAILNAVTHRDYTVHGRSVFIRISPTQFTVDSPGGFPFGITADNILTESIWRNRSIAEVFEKAGLVERSGQGMDDIFCKTISEGKGMPDFKGTDQYSVKLNIPSAVKDRNFILFLEKVIAQKQISLSFEEIYELERIRTQQKVEAPEYKEKFLSLGIIERIGKTKGAKYFLSHTYYSHEGKVGVHTKIKGLSRNKYKELILIHLEKNKGFRKDLIEALTDLKEKDITNLLQELKRDGKIEHQGDYKTGYWTLKK